MLNVLISKLWPGRQSPLAPKAHAPHAIYEEIVAQARQPIFYATWGVPDTVEGRFEMISLHAALLFRRLRGSDAEKLFAQDVFDVFFADMDGSLREMGVGDIVVPKRIAAMGEAFYGRAQAYGAGLDSEDDGVLADAVARNLLGRDEDDAAQSDEARALARYVREAEAALAEEDANAILGGHIDWPQLGHAG